MRSRLSDSGSPFVFSPKNRFAVAVEEQVWTVRPETGLLAPAALRMFGESGVRRESIRLGRLAQQIELSTAVYPRLRSLEKALGRNERELLRLAERHRFAVSRDPVPVKLFAIHASPPKGDGNGRSGRQYGGASPAAYTAGLSLRVGLGSREEAIAAMNVCRLHLPAFVALFGRSPVLAGRETGYRSSRYVQCESEAGEPAPPHLEDWEHFLRAAGNRGFLRDPASCRWLLRLLPEGMIEMRAADVQERRQATMAAAALFRLIVRSAVVKPRCFGGVDSELIEERMKDAALGDFDDDVYLGQIEPLAKSPGCEEELSYLKDLLG